MKIVIASDSFKGSLSSKQVNEGIKSAFLSVNPNFIIKDFVMADGGEGTIDAITSTLKNTILSHHEVLGPSGKNVVAPIVFIDEQTAVIEMATASGIELIDKSKREPMLYTTYGTGQLIIKAIEMGARHLLIGIGGSATNDAGAGMLEAFGAVFYDNKNQILQATPQNLNRIDKIDLSALDPRLNNVKIELLTDVTNPLVGLVGATYTFGPQKGLKESQLNDVEMGVNRFKELLNQLVFKDQSEIPGSGAGGGIAYALLSVTNAIVTPGAKRIIELSGIQTEIKDADILITGEGRFDHQTRYGKLPHTLAVIAKAINPSIRVIGISAVFSKEASELLEHGFDSIFSVVNRLSSLDDALNETKDNLDVLARSIAKLIKC
ncbi:MAG: glycerate kinase [Paracholeplasma sp.]|nr:glycerate kinase [Paracholeplasma sp.]MDY3195697.1 glycerate kinase [Paracholeplasma sp.]